VDAPRKWIAEWYTTVTGERPLKAFLDALERDEENRADALALLELLEARGNTLRPPRSESLGDGLFELRAHPRPVRIFYVFLPGRRIIALDGIVKKRGRIPVDVLKRVRGYQRDIESRIGR
jgi:hypothetical protein